MGARRKEGEKKKKEEGEGGRRGDRVRECVLDRTVSTRSDASAHVAAKHNYNLIDLID